MRARENARRSSCQSNLKQMGLGLTQYLQDFDERAPYSYTNRFNSNPPGGAACPFDTGCYKWMDAIYPYIKDEQLFNCPSAVHNASNGAIAYKYYTKASPAGSSYAFGDYAINVAYGGNANPFPTGPSSYPGGRNINWSQVAAPATTVWVMDSTRTSNFANNFQFYFYSNALPVYNTGAEPETVKSTDSSGGYVVERHLETINVLYCDGHVKAVKLASLMKSTGSGTSTVYPAFTIAAD